MLAIAKAHQPALCQPGGPCPRWRGVRCEPAFVGSGTKGACSVCERTDAPADAGAACRVITETTTLEELSMNQPTTPPPRTVPVDADLAEQARPDHGVPSQDPASAAQLPLEPEEAEREAKSVLVGGGMVAGSAAGAAVGVAVAGPVGAIVGGTVGAVVGAVVGELGPAAAGAMTSPKGSSSADAARAGTLGPRIEKGADRRPSSAQADGTMAAPHWKSGQP